MLSARSEQPVDEGDFLCCRRLMRYSWSECDIRVHDVRPPLLHAEGRLRSGSRGLSCAMSANSAPPLASPASRALAQEHRGAICQQPGRCCASGSPSVSWLLTAAAPSGADTDSAGRQAVKAPPLEQRYPGAPRARVGASIPVPPHGSGKHHMKSAVRICPHVCDFQACFEDMS